MEATPWCYCHFRGQSLVGLGLGSQVLIIDATSFLLVQRLTVDREVVALAWNEHRGCLAVVMRDSVEVYEHKPFSCVWYLYSRLVLDDALEGQVPVEARWAAYRLLVTADRKAITFSYAEEVPDEMRSPTPLFRRQSTLSLPDTFQHADICPNGALVATSYSKSTTVDVWNLNAQGQKLNELPHAACPTVVQWRPGLPGVLSILLTYCGDGRVQVWAEGKGGLELRLWTVIEPFVAAGCSVCWLRWANHGSTRASQHLQSRVRQADTLNSSNGRELLKTVAGSWIVGLDAEGSMSLWCVLNQHNPNGDTGRLPDNPEVIEVVSKSTWKAWKASSLGAAVESEDVEGANGVSDAVGQQLVATGFFDPRGVGVPANVELVYRPRLSVTPDMLVLLSLDTTLSPDGDLWLAAAYGARLLPSALRSSPPPDSLTIHPSFPFAACKGPSQAMVSTYFLFDYPASQVYNPEQDVSRYMPYPLPSIELPGNREPRHLLWVHDSSGLERSPPCLVVLDNQSTVLLYQAQLHKTQLPNLPSFSSRKLRNTFESLPLRTTVSNNPVASLGAGQQQPIYEVTLIPDPVYGLGMRLEKRDTVITVASFKRHPQTDVLLPAERSGVIVTGDALIGANGYSLQGLGLEQAVGVMRTVGAPTTGEVTLRFRRVSKGQGMDATGRGSRTASIYGIDFIGQAPGLERKLSDSIFAETMIMKGKMMKWHCCGVADLADDVEAACLVPLELLEEGDKRPGFVRIAVLVIVGISEDDIRELSAYEVLAAKNGMLALVELFRSMLGVGADEAEEEEDAAAASSSPFVFLKADQLFGNGFLVTGITAAGKVFRWKAVQDPTTSTWYVQLSQHLNGVVTTHLKACLGSTSHLAVCQSPSSLAIWSADHYDLDRLTALPSLDLAPSLSIEDLSIFLSNPRLDPLAAVAANNSTSFYRRLGLREPWNKWFSDTPGAAILAAAQVAHAKETIPKSFPGPPDWPGRLPCWHPLFLISILVMSNTESSDGHLTDVSLTALCSVLPHLGQASKKECLADAAVAMYKLITSASESLAQPLSSPALGQVIPAVSSTPRPTNDNASTAASKEIVSLSDAERLQLYALLSFKADIAGRWANLPRGKLDSHARAFLMANELRLHLLNFAPSPESPPPPSRSRNPEDDTRLLRSIVEEANKPMPVEEVAGTAVVAALLSSANDQIMDHLFPQGTKGVDWPRIRSVWPALWCRSVKPLRAIAEDVAITVFRQTQNPMKAALLYLALGKRAMLLQLAKASREDVARSLEKLLQHDTSTERGRVVAEKNAYHLLRKRDYPSAAALFLVGEPPNLSLALDVIVRHVRDLSLALLVGRLVEARLNPLTETGALGPATAEVMEKDVMPRFRDGGEKGLVAACCLWLGKPTEALDALSSTSSRPVERGQLPYEKALWTMNGTVDQALTPLVASAIDPLLAKSWKCITSTAASTFEQEGMELCGLEILNGLSRQAGLDASSPAQLLAGTFKLLPSPSLPREDLPTIMEADSTRLSSTHEDSLDRSGNSVGLSGILDNSGSPPRRRGNTGAMASSSIFDQYDVPPQAKPPPPSTDGNGLGSGSIFDQFDVMPPRPKPSQTASRDTGLGSGSIFDDFDVPARPVVVRPPPQQPATNDGGLGTGSIFDQYDVPPPRPKADSAAAAEANGSGLGSGSIFDQFDVPAPRQAQPPPPPPSDGSGLGSGSIFDQFDVPPRQQPAKPPPVSTDSGLGSGSIFDQFDGPPPPSSHPNVEGSGGTGGDDDPSQGGLRLSRPSQTSLRGTPMTSRRNSAASMGDTPSGGRSHMKGLPSDVSVLSFGIGGGEEEQTTPPVSPTVRRRQNAPQTQQQQNGHELSLSVTDYSEDETEAYRSTLLDLAFWVVERKTTLCAAQLVIELQNLLQECKGHCPLMAMDHSGAAGGHKATSPVPSAPGSFLAQAEGLLFNLCQRYEVESQSVLAAAVRTLGVPFRRLPVAALLVHMLNRPSTLNILIRYAVRKVFHRCCLASKALMGSELFSPEATGLPANVRQEFVNLVWDLELCLFLHIEGSLKLSRQTILEMTVGARVTLLLISWRVNYTALHLLISHPPHTNLVAEGSDQSLEEEEAPPPTPTSGGTAVPSEGGSKPTMSPYPLNHPLDRSFSDDLGDECSEDDDDDCDEVDPFTSLATTVADINRAEDNKMAKKRRSRGSLGSASEKSGRRRRSTASSLGVEMATEEKPPGASAGAGLPLERHSISDGGASLPSHENDAVRKQSVESAKSTKKKFGSAPDVTRARGAHEQIQTLSQRVKEMTRSSPSLGLKMPRLSDTIKYPGDLLSRSRHHKKQASIDSSASSDADAEAASVVSRDSQEFEKMKDPGWEHFRPVTRAEAEAYLQDKSPGYFLLRPKGNHLDLVLTAKTSEMQYHSLRHFVIRIISSTSLPMQYRCGSIGPYEDLEDLLYEVSSCLPTPLKLWGRRIGSSHSFVADRPSDGGDEGLPPPAWQRNYFALSPNATLLRTLLSHGGLQVDVRREANGTGSLSFLQTLSSSLTASPIGVVDTCTTRSIPPSLYFVQVIDLLVLRAVQRQCCDLLRLEAEDGPTPESHAIPSSASSLFAEDDLQSYFRLAYEADSIFFGPYARLKERKQYPKTMAEMSCHPTAGILAPLSRWADALERQIQAYLSPRISFQVHESELTGHDLDAVTIKALRSHPYYGDIIMRIMMRPDCDVHFQHVRVGSGPKSAYAVCFLASEAAIWLAKHGFEASAKEARQLFREMEMRHIIKRVSAGGKVDAEADERGQIFYRFIDPWQVDPQSDGAVGILSEGMVGRNCFEPIQVAEPSQFAEIEKLGPAVMNLCCLLRTDAWVKETISLAVSPLEREAGPTCKPDPSVDAFNDEQMEPYTKAITRHLYRNALFAQLLLPYRFMAMIQVDMTDIKNVVTGSAAQSVTANPKQLDIYVIVKLKRKVSAVATPGSGGSAIAAPVINARNRTIDTAMTAIVRVAPTHASVKGVSNTSETSMSTGLNTTFRFALPDECLPSHPMEAAEWINKGPPRVIHMYVYEKRSFISDTLLGDVEVPLTQLTDEDFLDQWLPLRSTHKTHTWLVRVQVLLSFLLMGIKDPPPPTGGRNSFSSPPRVGSDPASLTATLRGEGSTEDESTYGGLGPTTLMEDLG